MISFPPAWRRSFYSIKEASLGWCTWGWKVFYVTYLGWVLELGSRRQEWRPHPLNRSRFHWHPAIDYSAGSLAIIFRTARQFFSCRSAIEFRLLIELHLMLGSYWICIDYSPLQPRHSSWSSPRGVLVYLRFDISFHLLHKLTKRIRRKIPWAWKAGDFKRTATSEIENFHRHSNRFTKHRM